MDDTVVRARRAMMAAGQRCPTVNQARFGRSALHVLADLTEFDVLITDAPPAAQDRAALDRAGLRLTVAKEHA